MDRASIQLTGVVTDVTTSHTRLGGKEVLILTVSVQNSVHRNSGPITSHWECVAFGSTAEGILGSNLCYRGAQCYITGEPTIETFGKTFKAKVRLESTKGYFYFPTQRVSKPATLLDQQEEVVEEEFQNRIEGGAF